MSFFGLGTKKKSTPGATSRFSNSPMPVMAKNPQYGYDADGLPYRLTDVEAEVVAAKKPSLSSDGGSSGSSNRKTHKEKGHKRKSGEKDARGDGKSSKSTKSSSSSSSSKPKNKSSDDASKDIPSSPGKRPKGALKKDVVTEQLLGVIASKMNKGTLVKAKQDISYMKGQIIIQKGTEGVVLANDPKVVVRWNDDTSGPKSVSNPGHKLSFKVKIVEPVLSPRQKAEPPTDDQIFAKACDGMLGVWKYHASVFEILENPDKEEDNIEYTTFFFHDGSFKYPMLWNWDKRWFEVKSAKCFLTLRKTFGVENRLDVLVDDSEDARPFYTHAERLDKDEEEEERLGLGDHEEKTDAKKIIAEADDHGQDRDQDHDSEEEEQQEEEQSPSTVAHDEWQSTDRMKMGVSYHAAPARISDKRWEDAPPEIPESSSNKTIFNLDELRDLGTRLKGEADDAGLVVEEKKSPMAKIVVPPLLQKNDEFESCYLVEDDNASITDSDWSDEEEEENPDWLNASTIQRIGWDSVAEILEETTKDQRAEAEAQWKMMVSALEMQEMVWNSMDMLGQARGQISGTPGGQVNDFQRRDTREQIKLGIETNNVGLLKNALEKAKKVDLIMSEETVELIGATIASNTQVEEVRKLQAAAKKKRLDLLEKATTNAEKLGITINDALIKFIEQENEAAAAAAQKTKATPPKPKNPPMMWKIKGKRAAQVEVEPTYESVRGKDHTLELLFQELMESNEERKKQEALKAQKEEERKKQDALKAQKEEEERTKQDALREKEEQEEKKRKLKEENPAKTRHTGIMKNQTEKPIEERSGQNQAEKLVETRSVQFDEKTIEREEEKEEENQALQEYMREKERIASFMPPSRIAREREEETNNNEKNNDDEYEYRGGSVVHEPENFDLEEEELIQAEIAAAERRVDEMKKMHMAKIQARKSKEAAEEERERERMEAEAEKRRKEEEDERLRKKKEDDDAALQRRRQEEEEKRRNEEEDARRWEEEEEVRQRAEAAAQEAKEKLARLEEEEPKRALKMVEEMGLDKEAKSEAKALVAHHKEKLKGAWNKLSSCFDLQELIWKSMDMIRRDGGKTGAHWLNATKGRDVKSLVKMYDSGQADAELNDECREMIRQTIAATNELKRVEDVSRAVKKNEWTKVRAWLEDFPEPEYPILNEVALKLGKPSKRSRSKQSIQDSLESLPNPRVSSEEEIVKESMKPYLASNRAKDKDNQASPPVTTNPSTRPLDRLGLGGSYGVTGKTSSTFRRPSSDPSALGRFAPGYAASPGAGAGTSASNTSPIPPHYASGRGSEDAIGALANVGSIGDGNPAGNMMGMEGRGNTPNIDMAAKSTIRKKKSLLTFLFGCAGARTSGEDPSGAHLIAGPLPSTYQGAGGAPSSTQQLQLGETN